MAGYQPVHITPNTKINFPDGGATETVVITSGAVSTPGDNATVVISGTIGFTAATSATFVRVNVYRTPFPSGLEVESKILDSVVAGDSYVVPFIAVDKPGDVAGLTYDVTFTQGGATVDGTIAIATVVGVVF